MAGKSLQVPASAIEDALTALLTIEHFATMENEYCDDATEPVWTRVYDWRRDPQHPLHARRASVDA